MATKRKAADDITPVETGKLQKLESDTLPVHVQQLLQANSYVLSLQAEIKAQSLSKDEEGCVHWYGIGNITLWRDMGLFKLHFQRGIKRVLSYPDFQKMVKETEASLPVSAVSQFEYIDLKPVIQQEIDCVRPERLQARLAPLVRYVAAARAGLEDTTATVVNDLVWQAQFADWLGIEAALFEVKPGLTRKFEVAFHYTETARALRAIEWTEKHPTLAELKTLEAVLALICEFPPMNVTINKTDQTG